MSVKVWRNASSYCGLCTILDAVVSADGGGMSIAQHMQLASIAELSMSLRLLYRNAGKQRTPSTCHAVTMASRLPLVLPSLSMRMAASPAAAR